jgi:flagellar hook-associated protein 2
LTGIGRFSGVATGSFTVNGVTIAVDRDGDTLASVIARINDAGAGVTAAYDAAGDRLTFATIGCSEDLIAFGDDTAGFLDAAGLATGNTIRGKVRDDQQVLSKVASFAGIGSGFFTVNGVSIAVNAGSDTLTAVLQRITRSDAGVIATFDAARQTVMLTARINGDLPIEVEDDTTGFLGATRLDTGNTIRGHSADGVTIDRLGPFAGVRDGSFAVEWHTTEAAPTPARITTAAAASRPASTTRTSGSSSTG